MTGPWAPYFWGGHCLARDTPIPLLRGEDVPIRDLVGQRGLWVYGSTRDGRLIPARAADVVRTKRARTIRIVLDDGSSLRATPDHLFLLRDSDYKPAIDLAPGDSLMPLYREVRSIRSHPGYEFVRSGGRWQPTHTVVAEHLGLPRGLFAIRSRSRRRS
jgi:DNA gyrase subunit B